MDDAFAIGLDLGGTDLKSALIARDGAVRRFGRRGSRAADGEHAPLDAIAGAVADLERAGGAGPIALGLPGVVDGERGALVGATPHLPHWRDAAIGARLAERLGRPVTIDNDANLAALAEHRLGAARGARAALVVTVGTGVGCGIVLDGAVWRGAHGGAGEIGHLPLGGGRPCRCGVPGCVEPEMGGEGLAARAREAGLPAPDAEAVFALAARGEPAARALVARMAERLGATLAVAAHVVDPAIIVLGGGVAGAGEALLEPVRGAFVAHALATHARHTRIVAAALGERAGVVGAGLRAWEAAAR